MEKREPLRLLQTRITARRPEGVALFVIVSVCRPTDPMASFETLEQEVREACNYRVDAVCVRNSSPHGFTFDATIFVPVGNILGEGLFKFGKESGTDDR